ncbi:unnamed protein product [Phytophthora fragariaefolia]|uniref:Unnamed protein product n=1 Tax=Phytophthora fragariaefolia TaxID=1490495 RepID=A0A9W7D977_9STRA|nr:unnamed protein product [Phytophthora fragariaefolia]
MQRHLETPLAQVTQAIDVEEQQRHPRVKGAGFSDAEASSLLELLEMNLPISRDEWDYVASFHNADLV